MTIADICQNFLDQASQKLSSHLKSAKIDIQFVLIPLVSKLQIQLQNIQSQIKQQRDTPIIQQRFTSEAQKNSLLSSKRLNRLSALCKIKRILEQKQKLLQGQAINNTVVSITGISKDQLQKHLYKVNSEIEKIESQINIKSTTKKQFKLKLLGQNFNSSTISVSVTNRSSVPQLMNFTTNELCTQRINEDVQTKSQSNQINQSSQSFNKSPDTKEVKESIQKVNLPSYNVKGAQESSRKQQSAEKNCIVSASPLAIKNDQQLMKELLFNKELQQDESHILTQSIIQEQTQKISLLDKIIPDKIENAQNLSYTRVPKYLEQKLSSQLQQLKNSSSESTLKDTSYTQQLEQFKDENASAIYLPTLRQNSTQEVQEQRKFCQVKEFNQQQKLYHIEEQKQFKIEFKIDIGHNKKENLQQTSKVIKPKQIKKSTKLFLNKNNQQPTVVRKTNFLRKNTGRSCSTSRKVESQLIQMKKRVPIQPKPKPALQPRKQQKQNNTFQNRQVQSVKKTVFSKNRSSVTKSSQFKPVEIKGYKMQQQVEQFEMKDSFKQSIMKKKADQIKQMDSLELIENQNQNKVNLANELDDKIATPLHSVNSFFKNLKV